MKKLLCLALAASLSACAPGAATDRLAQAAPAIAGVEGRYLAAKVFVQPFLKYLSPQRRAVVELAAAAVEQALTAARTATTVAAQGKALRDAEAAATAYSVITGG